MRFDLRLLGVTETGRKCQAVISVYANSEKELKEQADLDARRAAWIASDPPYESIPDGSKITIENVQKVWQRK
jgi:hypothetical protein